VISGSSGNSWSDRWGHRTIGVSHQWSDWGASSWGPSSKAIAQPWLSLGLTLPNAPAWDWNVGSIDARGRLDSKSPGSKSIS